jgi:hypothetical protein
MPDPTGSRGDTALIGGSLKGSMLGHCHENGERSTTEVGAGALRCIVTGRLLIDCDINNSRLHRYRQDRKILSRCGVARAGFHAPTERAG